MPLSPEYYEIHNAAIEHLTEGPKRGEEIFAGTDYPRDWSGFIGQEKAKEQLQIQIASAKARGTRIEHTLLASGLHGVGKSTLATLTAYQAEAGLVRAPQQMTGAEALTLVRQMQDGDILFADEIHMWVSGNRNKADWLLPFMTEGILEGQRVPDVALMAATTDVGKLPQTLISRFMVQPQIVPYTSEEAARITENLAGRLGVDQLAGEHFSAIAQAADRNPRAMRQIIIGIRDLWYRYPDTHPNLAKAFDWAGASPDGLSQVARDMLTLLLVATNNTASIDSIKAHLGEPGPIRYHEQALLQRGLLEVTGRGRKLTDAGRTRARQELMERKAS